MPPATKEAANGWDMACWKRTMRVISGGRAVRGEGLVGGDVEACSPPSTEGGEGRALMMRGVSVGVQGEILYGSFVGGC